MSRKGIDFRLRALLASAMLTAISIVLTRFLSPQFGTYVRFSFGTIPIMLAGIMFGPIYGFAVGIVADLIGVFINSMGSSFIPTLTICSGLMGAVSGVLYKYALPSVMQNSATEKRDYIYVGTSAALTEITVSGFLKSLCLWQLTPELPYWSICVGKLLVAVIMAVVETIVLVPLINVLRKKFF